VKKSTTRNSVNQLWLSPGIGCQKRHFGVENLKRSEIIQFEDQIKTITKMKHNRINHISDKKYQFQEKSINLEFIRCLAVAAIDLKSHLVSKTTYEQL